MMSVSIIVPNYNEKENLNRGVLQEMAKYLKKVKFAYEVIINDDGSTDGGEKIISEFVKKNPNFKLIYGKHGGKAAGIWNGIQHATKDIVLFTDMDQSTPLKEAEKLLPWFEKGYDVVFGSRGRARENFAWYRQLMSWGFRTFRQTLLLKKVTDTQCGFKAFRRHVATEIFPQLSVIKNARDAKGWTVSAFDVELLFLSEKRGYKLKEVNVDWFDRDVSTSKDHNFIKESKDMLRQILAVKKRDILGYYDQK